MRLLWISSGGYQKKVVVYALFKRSVLKLKFNIYLQPNSFINKTKWDIRFIEKGAITPVEITMLYEDLAQLEAATQIDFKENLSMAMEGLDVFWPHHQSFNKAHTFSPMDQTFHFLNHIISRFPIHFQGMY